MATTVTSGNLSTASISTSQGRPVAALARHRPRRMTPAAGRAIEMLGHAIEYLTDEFVLECVKTKEPVAVATHPQMKAIELLMARNREVYFSCPEAPTLGERLRSLLNVRSRKIL